MAKDLIALSLSHHSAPVEVRERVALSAEEAKEVLHALKGTVLREAVVISTCNRTEIYGLPADPAVDSDYVLDYILQAKSLSAEEKNSIRQQFHKYSYCEAIVHLCEVTGGIDSQIIGDQQIFSQVKEAFQLSHETGAAGSFMTKLAHTAYRTAKRIKTETGIGVGAATISYAAVEFTRKVYDDLRERSALIIGAGETAELAAKHLCERKIGTLRVANRSIENAERVLNIVRGDSRTSKDEALGLDELSQAISKSDIIISSTAFHGYILPKQLVSQALAKRNASYPLILLDIAVPRDIDPEIAKLPNVFLKDIDDLRSIVDQNIERRKADIPKAKEIILEELDSFLGQLSKLEVGPTIKELREKFEAVRKEELERNAGKFTSEQLAAIDAMTRKMINRLLHTPTIALKEPHASLDELLTRIELVRALFALDNENENDENLRTREQE